MKSIGAIIVLIGICILSAEPIEPSLSLSLAGAVAGLATVGIGILIWRKYENNA